MSVVFNHSTVAIWQAPDSTQPFNFVLRGYVEETLDTFKWPEPAGESQRGVELQRWHLLGTFDPELLQKTKLLPASPSDITSVDGQWAATPGSHLVTSAAVSYDHVPLAHEASVDTLMLADYVTQHAQVLVNEAGEHPKKMLQISPNFKLFNWLEGGKLLKVYPARVANTPLKVELWYCGDFQLSATQPAFLQGTNAIQSFPTTGSFMLMVSR